MRLFFALWPPEHAVQALAGQAGVLAQRYGGKATRPESIHLTLAFLGEVEESLLPAVIQAAQAVSGRSFVLTVDRLGYWRHNRLLWAGCASRTKELEILVGNLCEQLQAASICCDERHPFTPHLTLVRKVPDRREQVDLGTIEPIAWHCGSFLLVRSRQTPVGSEYSAIAEFALDNGQSIAGGAAVAVMSWALSGGRPRRVATACVGDDWICVPGVLGKGAYLGSHMEWLVQTEHGELLVIDDDTRTQRSLDSAVLLCVAKGDDSGLLC